MRRCGQKVCTCICDREYRFDLPCKIIEDTHFQSKTEAKPKLKANPNQIGTDLCGSRTQDLFTDLNRLIHLITSMQRFFHTFYQIISFV